MELALTMLVSCCTGCGKTAGVEADSENPLFSCGLLPVRDDETFQYGYMNKKGMFVIPPQFQDAERFSPCGLAAVKIDGTCLFIRSILGKYTIGTMVPVMLLVMVLLEVLGIVGPVVIALICLLQVVLMIATHNHSAIHDCLANTVVVDLPSQMIFGSESELIDYKKRIHEEMANRASY